MPADSTLELRARRLLELKKDRWLAHATLFRHRHPDASCDAHKEIVRTVYGPLARVQIEGFRGLAKTTYLEEAATLKASFGEFHNMVIVGPSFERACDRILVIKNELLINEYLLGLFGEQKGPIWQDGKIVLANGVCIQALGRDQSMTGMKHLEWRPDAFLIDDVEDPRENRSDIERAETWRWLMTTFLPSLDDAIETWGRVLGTRRGRGSLPERLERAGWPTVKFPIEHKDEATGARRATWPAKFPLPKIDQLIEQYRGDMDTYMQEFMCEAVSVADRTFGQIPVKPQVRTWEACWAMYDPARTVGPKSATTGKVVWSWIRNRLVIWESAGELWLPDQLIADIFDVNERFGPVWIGVEDTGLNEWIRQPLRHEQARRGIIVPVKPMPAPRGKLDFIKALQPYANAGEIEFACEMPDFQAQLSSFPHGRIDIPNAAAYALQMRPGAPIYDGFRLEHVADTLPLGAGPVWLAANATRGLVTAALIQSVMGRTRIVADWAIEAEPLEAVPVLLREIGMRFRVAPTASVGPQHLDRWQNVGLMQSFAAVPLLCEVGAEPATGRKFLREELGRLVREMPAIEVSREAKMTLNALAGGYARSLRGAGLSDEAEPGLYRILMEGIESCLGRMAIEAEVDTNANWSYTADGRRYQRYGSARR